MKLTLSVSKAAVTLVSVGSVLDPLVTSVCYPAGSLGVHPMEHLPYSNVSSLDP